MWGWTGLAAACMAGDQNIANVFAGVFHRYQTSFRAGAEYTGSPPSGVLLTGRAAAGAFSGPLRALHVSTLPHFVQKLNSFLRAARKSFVHMIGQCVKKITKTAQHRCRGGRGGPPTATDAARFWQGFGRDAGSAAV